MHDPPLFTFHYVHGLGGLGVVIDLPVPSRTQPSYHSLKTQIKKKNFRPQMVSLALEESTTIYITMI